MIKLCALSEITSGAAREFKLTSGENIFVLNSAGTIYAYVNSCPHARLPLNFLPDKFLDFDRKLIQCSNHMALFEIHTGECVAGPCIGSRLTPVEITTKDESLWLMH